MPSRHASSTATLEDEAPYLFDSHSQAPGVRASRALEHYVHARSFLFGTSFDLKRLLPKYRHVVVAAGNDYEYMVLEFQPSHDAPR